MRESICINSNWHYINHFDNDFIYTKEFCNFNIINLPHSNIEIPLNYFDEKTFQFVSCYAKIIHVKNEWANKRLFLDFEGVMVYAEVYINGRLSAEHKGGYTGFTVEITDYVNCGDNFIVVKVDSTERVDIPPFGYSVDFLTFGGIYRDVNLIVTDKVYIKDVYSYCKNPLHSTTDMNVEIEIDSLPDIITGILEVRIEKSGEISAVKTVDLFCRNGITKQKLIIDSIKDIMLWDIDNPVLYDIVVELKGDSYQDKVISKLGFREAKFTAEGFYLNGKKVKLMGLNRHQSFPYVGYAMPKRVQQKDADILKKELGINIVRTSHYPQSRHFLDRCDEIGLLVMEEIPGWQHIGDEAWKEAALQSVSEMIYRDRNRPCIVLWGIRINESIDDHELYTKTNMLARKLDPSRQTGGVRCIEGSEFLEDVYTMNDFIYAGDNQIIRSKHQATKLETDVPYLITEFAGHTFPTKSYDQEERAVEHLKRHMLINEAVGTEQGISGAIAWCAFDYPTHSNFGSGDKICYHGVMDIFRLPKFASYFYKSQKSPEKEVVLEAATRWAYGERNMGGIFPLLVFTNCDYIELYLNGKFTGKYTPQFEKYRGLMYPPIEINDIETFWGENWSGGVLSGYYKGKKVKSKEFVHNPIPSVFSVEADDIQIYADGCDTTRIVVKALDQVENVLPFYFSPIEITVTGAADLIGSELVSLQGGVYAFWIRNNGRSGEINIIVRERRLGETRVRIEAL